MYWRGSAATTLVTGLLIGRRKTTPPLHELFVQHTLSADHRPKPVICHRWNQGAILLCDIYFWGRPKRGPIWGSVAFVAFEILPMQRRLTSFSFFFYDLRVFRVPLSHPLSLRAHSPLQPPQNRLLLATIGLLVRRAGHRDPPGGWTWRGWGIREAACALLSFSVGLTLCRDVLDSTLPPFQNVSDEQPAGLAVVGTACLVRHRERGARRRRKGPTRAPPHFLGSNFLSPY